MFDVIKSALVTALAVTSVLTTAMRASEEPGTEPTPETTPTATATYTYVHVPKKTTAPEPELVTEIPIDAYEAELIGRTIWGEAGGVPSEAERAAVAWCILNRVDAWGQSIEEVVTKPYQFQGYRTWGECPQEHIDLAVDVLTRWKAEKQGKTDAGRVLPAEYMFFMGDGKHNHFTTEYRGTDYWDWSLTDPYK
jgi:hypothetical protein